MTAHTWPAAQAGSRRFWITVVCFAMANAAVWVAYHQLFGPRKGLLRVESFTPGDGAILSPRPALLWRFNLPVAPRNTTTVSPPVRITPAIAGQWQWRNDRTLSFVPDGELPQATAYTLAIAPESLSTADGFHLRKPFVATVKTEPLKVLTIRQAGFESGNRFLLEAEFNDRVLPGDVVAKMSIQAPDGSPVAFRLHGDAVGNLVRVWTDPVAIPPARGREGPQLTVCLQKGLVGLSGPLGLAEPVAQNVAVGSALAVTGAEARCPAKGQASIILTVNDNDPPLETTREVISVEPALPLTISGNSYGRLFLQGDFEPGKRYTIRIAEPPKGADPAKFPRPDLLSVYVPDREKSAWFEHEEGYLGAKGNRALLAHAVNIQKLRIAIWRVYDNNIVTWRNFAGRYSQPSSGPFSHPVATRTITLPLEKNRVHDLRVQLDELLPAEAASDGAYRLTLAEILPPRHGAVEKTDEADDDDDVGETQGSAIVTLSDIGLSAQQSPGGIAAWAVSLSTAKPLPRVHVRVFSSKNQLLGAAITDADGLAFFKDIHPAEGERPRVLLASLLPEKAQTTRPAATQPTTAPGLTWLDLYEDEWNLADTDISGRPYLRKGHEAFVYTDRGVYRPGETVHLRAIVRDAERATPAAFPVLWQIRRPDSRNWRGQVVMLDADGCASLELPLPNDLVTGRWTAHVALPGSESTRESFGSVAFQIEQYIPNNLKVKLTLDQKPTPASDQDSRRLAVGEAPLAAMVQADYLFGRPAAGLRAQLSARIDPAHFAPAKWSGWTFGDAAALISMPATSPMGAVPAERKKPAAIEDKRDGMLDENGHGRWEFDLPKILGLKQTPATQPPATIDYRGPWSLAVSASVQEAGGRAVTATDYIDLDVLSWYIGIGSKDSVVPGLAATFQLNLVTPQGSLAAADAKLDVAVFRERWNNTLVYKERRYFYESHRVLDPVEKAGPAIVAVATGQGAVQITVPSSGAYVLRVKDPASGAMTSMHFYASDGRPWQDNISRDKPEKLQLAILPIGQDGASGLTAPATTPIKSSPGERFRVGQGAAVLVRSPFAGRLLLTVQTDEVLQTHVIDMAQSAVTVPIEITQACRPNAYVTASVIRPIDPEAKWQVHRAYGVARLHVDPGDRRLDVQVSAASEIRPESTLDVKLRVLQESGAPASNAAVSITAVDEGILQLTNFATPDPLRFFHATRALAVTNGDMYSRLMPEVLRPTAASPVGGDGDGGLSRYRTPVTAQRVRPVALFAGVVHTDAAGLAMAHLPVPQFSGRLRIMAVGSAGSSFGSSEQAVLVRAPLVVQSSFPRFAAPGDRFVVPVVLFNNGQNPGQATITAELLDSAGAPDPLRFASSEQRLITLPPVRVKAAGQETARIEFAAAQATGIARVRLTAAMNGEHYREEIALPIRPSSPTITLGGYAAVSPEMPLKLDLPQPMLIGTERLEIRVTPWPTLQLPEGLDYLERYPYGCAEQTISTAFPLVYLSDLGPLIAPGVFARQRVADKVQAAIVQLIGMQTADGGIGMWPGSRESWPWASVYAAHFIVEAEAAGHAVPDDLRLHLLSYVRRVLDKSGDDGDLLENQAYGCRVLALAGKPERAVMSRLTELANAANPSALPEFAAQRAQARLHLAMGWLVAGRRDLAGTLVPLQSPPPREKRQLGGNVGSPVRDRVILIEALLMLRPDDPALPSLAQELADTGRKQQWRSTQDCAFAIMALGKYFKQAKSQQPYESARLLAGSEVLSREQNKPLIWNSTSTTLPNTGLTVCITGPAAARGHVSWIQTGVPTTQPANVDRGLKVRRRYLAEHGEALTSNVVRSGDLVQVEITLEAPPNCENLVIEDLLPAGLEIENPRLSTSQKPGHLPRAPSAEERVLQHLRLDMRDDRMVMLGNMPASGTITQVYLARAVTPGTYTVPPVRAECMYDIGLGSISGAGGTLVVQSADAKPLAKSE